jgi:hypothetical protein
MSAIRTDRDISAEELQQVLTAQLGPRYQIIITSPTTLKVRRNSLMFSTVRIGHDRELHVHSFGLIIGRAVNALTITPKVRQALCEAFQ